MLKALELFLDTDPTEKATTHQGWLELVRSRLDSPAEIREQGRERPPLLVIELEDAETAFTVCRALRRGSPSIHVGHGELRSGRLVVDPSCLAQEQVEPLALGLAGALRAGC